MDAKDLRIGNYIQDVWANELYFKITSLAKKTCTYENIQEFKTDYNKLRPIPLTEDWLVRFGFKKDRNSFWIPLLNFDEYLEINLNKKIVNIWPCDGVVDSQCITINLEFIHTLQNIYFTLTGKELILKNELWNG